MNDTEIVTSKFDQLLLKAINKLKNDELVEAYQYILQACEEDPNDPKPHNLLGIWYEYKGKTDLARKHYRIAYVLDPTYLPASENLERISTLFPYKNISVNYGEVSAEEIHSTGVSSKKQ